jgi:hypothetical protein
MQVEITPKPISGAALAAADRTILTSPKDSSAYRRPDDRARGEALVNSRQLGTADAYANRRRLSRSAYLYFRETSRATRYRVIHEWAMRSARGEHQPLEKARAAAA